MNCFLLQKYGRYNECNFGKQEKVFFSPKDGQIKTKHNGLVNLISDE